MTDQTDTREQGVEFGALADELDSHEYPATAGELVDAYGDHELELPNGQQTFGDVLGPLEAQDDERYESAEEVRQMVLNMVADEAVGREGYSDRGTSTEPNSDDQQSL